MNKTTIPPETVGRKYERTRFAVLSRRVGTEGWYGTTTYKTEAEAREHFERCLKPRRYERVGGITLDFGKPGEDEFEYKLVRIVSQNEVLAVGTGRV